MAAEYNTKEAAKEMVLDLLRARLVKVARSHEGTAPNDVPEIKRILVAIDEVKKV